MEPPLKRRCNGKNGSASVSKLLIQSMTAEIRDKVPSINMDDRFMDALSQFHQDPVAAEFFDALDGNAALADVTVDITSSEDKNELLERLGRALGTLSKLSGVKLHFLDRAVAVQAAALLLKPLRQVKDVEWNIHRKQGPMGDVLDANTAIDTCSAAFSGNTSIETMTLIYLTKQLSLVAGICQTLNGLVGLNTLRLYEGDDSGPFELEQAERIASIFQSKSIRHLRLVVSFADSEAALMVSRAISQSALSTLEVNDVMGPVAIDLGSALAGSCLKRLELSGITLREYEPAMAFCRALAGSQIEELVCNDDLEMHEEAEQELCTAACRPCLKMFQCYVSSCRMMDSISESLNNAPHLQYLHLIWNDEEEDQEQHEQSIVNVLNACQQCTNLLGLEVLELQFWSPKMDQAAADVMKHCKRLQYFNF